MHLRHYHLRLSRHTSFRDILHRLQADGLRWSVVFPNILKLKSPTTTSLVTLVPNSTSARSCRTAGSDLNVDCDGSTRSVDKTDTRPKIDSRPKVGRGVDPYGTGGYVPQYL